VPVAGARKPRLRPVEIDRGRSGPLSHATASVRLTTYDDKYRDRFYRGLIWIAREKAYKPGWASSPIQNKFGEWPKSRTPPVPEPPDPEVRSWVRSEQITLGKIASATRAGGR